MITYHLNQTDLNRRADLIIGRHQPQLSRSHIKNMAKNNQLFFNGQPIAASFKLKQIGTLSLNYDLADLEALEAVTLAIVHQDSSLVIINKPSGLISHARGRFWQEASVASSVRSLLAAEMKQSKLSLRHNLRAGLVHRLDRGTSGLMIIAKTKQAQVKLQAQFSQRTINKTYLGIIEAKHNLPNQGLIDKPIRRANSNRAHFRVDINGKPAQTFFHLQSLVGGASFQVIKLQPQTGRTHQLRVHLASLNCPLVGDSVYGGKTAPRLMLHAWKLQFRHPANNEICRFTAPIPDCFKNYLKPLKK